MSQRRLVLITGGSGEIGAEIVRTLVADGFDVIFTYFANEERAAGLATIAEAVSCDLGCDADLERLADMLTDRLVFGFVHVAGVSCDNIVATIPMNDARRTMDVNFWSYVTLSKLLVRGMSRARAGRIVAITSVAAARGSRGNSIYGASKAAIEGFNRSFATEYAHKGVTVNAIAPGFVETAMIAKLPDLTERVVGVVPLGRCASVHEIAPAVAFLMSDAASYVNGSVLTIDGGLSTSIGR